MTSDTVSTFECASCGGEFEKLRSDEEASTEAKFLWGESFDPTTCEVVCEACFASLMTWRGLKIGRA